MYLFQLVIILSVFDSNTAATAVGAGAFAATTAAVSSCFF
jgi:hypothetical protein